MECSAKVSGAVLPVVMVVSTLLMLVVLSVMSLWEADFLFFSRSRHDAVRMADIASGFTLYREYPNEVLSRLDPDSTLLLYDSVPQSRITIRRTPWGLYERVSITAGDGKTRTTKLLGRRSLCRDEFTVFCRNRGYAVTLTGKTNLKGRVFIPSRGIMYGHMGSTFFDGEKLDPGMIGISYDSLPTRDTAAVAVVKRLLATADGDVTIGGGRLRDTIVVGRRVRIESGFRGSVQVFATDSLTVESGVTLEYPSGLFSQKYIDIGERSAVNGYVVVDPAEKPDPRYANYVQSRLAVVRGLLWVGGMAQLQGIVSGTAILDRAACYSPRGYYDNMLYDVTVLENDQIAWPLWLAGPPQRKEAKWID